MHKLRRLYHKCLELNDVDFMKMLESDYMDLMFEIKKTNPSWYKNIEKKYHMHFYGDEITEEMAKEMVCKMINEDGTTGEHWSIEDTEKNNPHKCNKWKWYVALNMIRSDYYDVELSTERYIKMAHQWLHDKDGNKYKLIDMYYDR